jgi:hypothetical protein
MCALSTTDMLKRLQGPAAAAAGASTLITVPAGHLYTIKKIKIVNTDVVNTKTFQLFINGAAAGDSITPVYTVDAGGSAESEEFVILAATDTLRITTSATGLTVSVYGLDQA